MIINSRHVKLATAMATAATLAVVLSACSGGGATPNGSGTEVATTTIRVAYPHAATSADNDILTEMAVSIEKRTNGRVKLELYPDGQLGSNADLLDQAAAGGDVAAFIDASSAADRAGFDDLGILSGPYLFDGVDHATKFASSELFSNWMDEFETGSDLKMLALNWFETPRDMIGNAGWPNPDDLKGVSLRLPPLAAWLDTFEPLGVTPVTLSWGEVFGGLQQGVIAGVESPVNTFAQGHFEEVATDFTATHHILPWLGYAMGKKAFSALTPEDQSVLLEEFFNGGIKVTKANSDKAAASLATLESAGVKIHKADIAAYKAATGAFYANHPGFIDLKEQVLKAAKG